MPKPNFISGSQLFRLIGTPDCPPIIDVRIAEDFDDDPRIIPTAIRRNFDDIEAMKDQFCGKSPIIYCQKGLKISQGTAAILRHEQVKAGVLEGGQFAWRDAGLPMINWKNVPRLTANSSTLWVTRHRPKIDRIACPWLIKRFVDPTARFLFVEPSQVMNVAERFDAIPFDFEDVRFSHKGEWCSFETMLEEFGLASIEALSVMAKIIRGADTDNHGLAPEASGLFAVSVGLSRMFREDLDQLEAGLLVYDALYRWARDARNETHDWVNH